MAPLSRTNIQRRSRPVHVSRFRIFPQINQPITKRIRASGMSVRTSVARRGVNKLRLNAQAATKAAARPYVAAARAMRNRRARPAGKEGKRHAKYQERVMAKYHAEIQQTSGGLDATPPFGAC